MDIKILVATHKKYQMPKDKVYLPIYVGAEGKENIGFIGDDGGENISSKNYYYNELTAIYWAWKNLNAEYIGLVHYRRHFTKKNFITRLFTRDKWKIICSGDDIRKEFLNSNIIVPNKRRYWIETIESHYKHLPYTINSDLQCLKDVICDLTPEYSEYLEIVLKRTWAHMFNMFIMNNHYFDEYCKWLFLIIKEVDKRVSMKGRKSIEARLYISEFMLDTWLLKNKIIYREVPVIFMEKQNWLVKGGTFLKRKVWGK